VPRFVAVLFVFGWIWSDGGGVDVCMGLCLCINRVLSQHPVTTMHTTVKSNPNFAPPASSSSSSSASASASAAAPPSKQKIIVTPQIPHHIRPPTVVVTGALNFSWL
jgi:hypothetical protein